MSISNDTALFHIAQTAFHFLEEMQKSFTVNIIFNIYSKLSQQKGSEMKKNEENALHNYQNELCVGYSMRS